MKKSKENVYRCEYCNKPYFSSSGCKRHESYCFLNEKREVCSLCIHCTINGTRCYVSHKHKTKTITTSFDDSYFIVGCTGFKRKELKSDN